MIMILETQRATLRKREVEREMNNKNYAYDYALLMYVSATHHTHLHTLLV